MRPKKPCILYCANETRVSLVRFAVKARMPDVQLASARNLAELIERWDATTCCVTLVRDKNPTMDAEVLGSLAGLMQTFPEAVVIDVAHETAPLNDQSPGKRIMTRFDCGVLLAALVVACKRKRGPKKKYPIVSMGDQEMRQVA